MLFTSESVNSGHPDKMADLVSDSILDAIHKIYGKVENNEEQIKEFISNGGGLHGD